jgi:hypothetical protein
MNEEQVNCTPGGEKADRLDCGCDGNCCTPKKKSILPKLIFAVVMLAALGVIAAKLSMQPDPSPAAGRQVPSDQGSPACCDSSASKTCDTTKTSSCCPK